METFGAEFGAQAPPSAEAALDTEKPAKSLTADQPGPQTPADDAPTPTVPAAEEPAAQPPAEQPAVALANIPIPVESAPPLVPSQGDHVPPADRDPRDRPGDVETVAARRARRAARKRRSRRIPGSLVIVMLAALAASLLGLRKDVVRYVPQMASLYNAIGLPVNLRGLAFADLKIGNEVHDGVPILVIEGVIVSLTSKPVEMPRLRFALRNPAGAELYAWTAQPPQPMLEPFDSVPFRSRLASPPADGHDIQVRFFTRRDAVASR